MPAGHAEIGAYLFSTVNNHNSTGKQLIPEHLALLIQYAGSAHTHYLRDLPITITKEDGSQETFIRKAYPPDFVSAAMKTVRLVDRSEMVGHIGFLRNIFVHALPSIDFSDDQTFDELKASEQEEYNFRFSHNPTEDGKRTIVGHCNMFNDNYHPKEDGSENAYVKGDTAHARTYTYSGKSDMYNINKLFASISSQSDEALEYLIQQEQAILIKAKRLSFHVEPSAKMAYYWEKFEEKFHHLPPKDKACYLALLNNYCDVNGMLADQYRRRMAWAQQSYDAFQNTHMSETQSLPMKQLRETIHTLAQQSHDYTMEAFKS